MTAPVETCRSAPQEISGPAETSELLRGYVLGITLARQNRACAAAPAAQWVVTANETDEPDLRGIALG